MPISTSHINVVVVEKEELTSLFVCIYSVKVLLINFRPADILIISYTSKGVFTEWKICLFLVLNYLRAIAGLCNIKFPLI